MRRLLTVIGLQACLWGMPAQAAVTLDNCEASSFALSGTGGSDNSFTVGAGSNQLLVLLIAQSNSIATPTATWNGVSLSPVSGATNTNVSIRTDIFILAAPAQGNKTLVVSTVGVFAFSSSVLCSFNGVNQSTPTQNGTSAGPLAVTSISINVTSATGDQVVAVETSSSSVSSVNQTQIFLDGNGGANRAAGAASVTMSATFGGGSNGSAAGMDIVAAGAAATCSTRVTLTGAGC